MYKVIYNPSSQSGKGEEYWQDVKQVFESSHIRYEAYATTPEKGASVIAKNIFINNPEGIIRLMVLGGDGTINDTLQSFTDNEFSRTILYYLPTGSSNDLARDLEFDSDLVQMAKGYIRLDSFRKMDVGLLEYNNAALPGYKRRYFLVSAGIGFDASVCHEAMNSKIKNAFNKVGLGKLSYVGITFKQLMKIPKVNITIQEDNGPEKYLSKCYFVSVMNHKYQGGGLMFCPDACDYDGKLDVCYAAGISKLGVLKTLPTAYKGNHVNKKGIGISKMKTINIKSSELLYVHTDGEVMTKSDDITIKVLANKLNFAVYK